MSVSTGTSFVISHWNDMIQDGNLDHLIGILCGTDLKSSNNAMICNYFLIQFAHRVPYKNHSVASTSVYNLPTCISYLQLQNG